LTKEYRPSSLVVKVCFADVAALVRVSCAPATAEPEASVTVPEIEPKVDWADSGEPSSIAARQKQKPIAKTRRNRSDDFLISFLLPQREAR
jgi:hypothetical protein